MCPFARWGRRGDGGGVAELIWPRWSAAASVGVTRATRRQMGTSCGLREYPVEEPRAAGAVLVCRRRAPRCAEPAAVRLAPGCAVVPGAYGEAAPDSGADFWWPSKLCMTATRATGRTEDVFLRHLFMVHMATWPPGTGPRMVASPRSAPRAASCWTVRIPAGGPGHL